MDSNAEFEMLVNVLVAKKRLMDAVGWCERSDKATLGELSNALNALERVKEMCGDDNIRLAEMRAA